VGVVASFPPARECKRDVVVLTKGDERTILGVGEAVAKKVPGLARSHALAETHSE
jgi:hypothetical protein